MTTLVAARPLMEAMLSDLEGAGVGVDTTHRLGMLGWVERAKPDRQMEWPVQYGDMPMLLVVYYRKAMGTRLTVILYAMHKDNPIWTLVANLEDGSRFSNQFDLAYLVGQGR